MRPAARCSCPGKNHKKHLMSLHVRANRFLAATRFQLWVDSALYEKIGGLFATGQKVATKKDASDTESLRRFVGQ